MVKSHIINISFILKFISLIESMWLFVQPTPRIGLDYIWLLPLTYFFSLIFWGDILSKSTGIGIKIYIIISIFRYLIQPYLIVLSHGELNHRMPNAYASSYEVAIVIYILECLIAFCTIHYYYGIERKKYICYLKKNPTFGEKYDINVLGWIVFFFFIFILLIRINIWLPSLAILGLKSGADKIIVLEASFFNVIKCFIFVFLLLKSYKTKSKFILCLALFAALFNFISYFGTNRSFIFETALSTIFLLISIYPQYKKRIVFITVPFAIIIISFMYVTKQFGVDSVSEYEVSKGSDAICEYSNIIEEYVNGLWTVARSYQASIDLPLELSLSAFVKDIMDGLSPLRDIPFLKTEVFPLSDSLLSSSDIFKLSLNTYFEYAQMLSFSGGMFILAGTILGWPLMIIANILIIRLLVRMDVRSVCCKNFFYKYMYIWMSCLLGLVHCYCIQTILFCWSKFILFYWLILLFNNLYRKRV